MPQGEQRQSTPDDLEITHTAREPETRSDLGVPFKVETKGSPRHRLVTVGDSLTHGFQSGAIFNTDLSYPAIIAWELGCYEFFRHPRYPRFGGIPFNIELHIRELEVRYGDELSPLEMVGALFHLYDSLAEAEHWWDGPGSVIPKDGPINHNLGIYGWDLRDALSRTVETAHERLRTPNGHHFVPLVRNADLISAGRVLGSARTSGGLPMTPLQAAAALAREGGEGAGEADGDGIETLIVALGANNALGTVLSLSVHWSGPGYEDLQQKAKYNVWHPEHFAAEWAQVVAKVREIRASHVIFATVPHVTIAPIAHGVGGKLAEGSRYFRFYTRPWISEDDFDPQDDPHLTGEEARAIDSAIDGYNATILSSIKAAREEGRDWRVLDLAGLLDRLARRRYIDDPAARPEWWSEYELPEELTALDPPPDARFFTSGPSGRVTGGLISLDGIHPTTIAYGLMAQEFIRVMQEAGVAFMRGDGLTPRTEEVVRVDWKRLIERDTLISQPPAALSSDLALIGWFDERIDILKRLWAGAA
jgi:hypothetical protein